MVEKDLLYTKEHEWVKRAGDVAIMGITDHAQSLMGETPLGVDIDHRLKVSPSELVLPLFSMEVSELHQGLAVGRKQLAGPMEIDQGPVMLPAVALELG